MENEVNQSNLYFLEHLYVYLASHLLIIQKLNGFEFNGSKLRVELSEKKDSASNKRNSGNLNKNKKRKDFKKIVHSDAPNLEAPDPRWAGELSKLKDLLANQKTPA